MELTLLDTLDVGGATQDNYLKGDYIHVANATDGIVAMTYAGGVLTSVGNYNPSSHAYQGIYVDASDNIYAVRISTLTARIVVLTFDGSNYTLQATSASFQTGTSDMRIWGDGTYVYVGTGSKGLRAFQYVGGNITLKATYIAAGRATDVQCADGYIFTGNRANGIAVFTFNGAAFTLIDSVDDIAGTTTSIFWDGSRLHQRMTGFLRAFTFVTGSLSLEKTHVLANESFQISGMWGANGRIFLADCDDLKLFTYDEVAKEYTLEDTHASGVVTYGVHGKPGQYVTLSNWDLGVRLYGWPGVTAGQIIIVK